MPRKKGLYPTPRDLAFAAELGEVTVMDVPMIRRHYPVEDSCLRRLRQMRGSQLIAPVAPELAPSPRDAVYRLTERGGAWLAFHSGHPPRRMLHADPKPISLPHRRLVARMLISINDAAVAASVPKPDRWMLDHDRLPEASCSLPIPQQYVLAEDLLALPTAADRPVEHYGPPDYRDPKALLLKVRPDAACLLALPGEPATHAFYFEADNGTETHSQLLRKFPAYHALLTTHAYLRHFPDHHQVLLLPRVIFVFTSAERLTNILDRLRANPTVVWNRPPKYQPTPDDLKRSLAFLDQHFRFAVIDQMMAPDMLRQPIWRTVSAQAKAIYPLRVSA